MPTAVELKYEDFIDSFLELDAIDGKAEQAALAGAFRMVDPDFAALAGATGDTIASLEKKYMPVFDTISRAFVKCDGDFQDVATIGSLIDLSVEKLSGAAAADEHADWIKLDASVNHVATGLGNFGNKFLSLDQAASSSAFLRMESALGDGSVRLGAQLRSAGAKYDRLGRDFLDLGGVQARVSPLDSDYLKLGSDMQGVGKDFAVLSTDFNKLGADLHSQVAAGAGGSLGTDFDKIDGDLIKLEGGLLTFGGPAADIVTAALRLNGAS